MVDRARFRELITDAAGEEWTCTTIVIQFQPEDPYLCLVLKNRAAPVQPEPQAPTTANNSQ